MDFSKFNKQGEFKRIEWGIDTKNFEFVSLTKLYNENERCINIKGFFFMKSKEYGLQAVAICDNKLVNIPRHYNDVIEEILKDDDAVNDIKKGLLMARLSEYESHGKQCISLTFFSKEEQTTKPQDFQSNIF